MLGEQFVRDMRDIIPEVVNRTKRPRLGAVDFNSVNGCVQAHIRGSQLTVFQECPKGCSHNAPIGGSIGKAPVCGSITCGVEVFDGSGNTAPVGGMRDNHMIRRRIRGKTNVSDLMCWSPWVHNAVTACEEAEEGCEVLKKRHMLRLRLNAFECLDCGKVFMRIGDLKLQRSALYRASCFGPMPRLKPRSRAQPLQRGGNIKSRTDWQIAFVQGCRWPCKPVE